MPAYRRIGSGGTILGRDLIFRLDFGKVPQMGARVAVVSSQEPGVRPLEIGEVRDIVGPVSCPWIVVRLSVEAEFPRGDDTMYLAFPPRRFPPRRERQRGKEVQRRRTDTGKKPSRKRPIPRS